ncbi:MAG: alpha-mannosidase, partial [Sphaerospermopsis kisseleviana]
MDTTSISKTVENLRSLCQINILSSWVYQQGNLEVNELEVNEVVNSDLSEWQSVKINQKNQVVWDGGKQVLWLAQRFTVPESLQGYPLSGLSLRLSLLWWADAVEVYVNGNLVLIGDLFDCSPRVLLSQGVKPGDAFFVCLRLVSPGHCDGALVRSLLIFESLDYNDVDPGIVADELAITHVLLERFSPQGLAGLVAGVDEVRNRKGAKNAKEEREEEDWKNVVFNLRQLLLQSKIQNLKSKIYLLGHAHLDLAWLWPVSETWNAAQNTFESVLRLQSDFSELIFCHS